VFVGVNGDDIYADKGGKFIGPPGDVDDDLLLPTR
jgi:hypothetical protein